MTYFFVFNCLFLFLNFCLLVGAMLERATNAERTEALRRLMDPRS